MRLGVPCLVYTYILSPLLVLFTMAVGSSNYDDPWPYVPVAGHLWFLEWLLLFNVCYAVLPWKKVPIPFPSTPALVLWGLFFGCLSSLIIHFGFVKFVGMPFFNYVGTYIVAFCAGITAKQNRWLDRDIPSLPEKTRYIMRWLTLMLIGVSVFIFFVHGLDGFLPPGWHFAHVMVRGVLSVSVCFVLLETFGRYLKDGVRHLKLFSDAAYTVYILHGWVVVLITWTYVSILHHNGVKVDFNVKPYNVNSPTRLPSDAFLWLGFTVTSILSTAIVWPLCVHISRLPGVSSFL